MLRKLWWISLALAALVLVQAVPGTAKDAVPGRYAVSGNEPGSPPDEKPEYSGTAEIKPVAGGYAFTAVLDGHEYSGRGVFDAKAGVLGFLFTSRDRTETGMVLLTPVPGGFMGRWIYLGQPADTPGREIWRKAE